MKQIFTFLFLAVVQSASPQVVMQSQNLVVPCCSTVDSIDIRIDNQYDIQIRSMFYFDSAQITDSGLYSQIKVTSVVDSGTVFEPIYFNPYGGGIAQTSILCQWNSVWFPNSGMKYSGFEIVNAPNDTTFGWIRLDFRGNASSCEDTVFSDLLAYSTQPNVHLNAGQISITGIQENKIGDLFKVFYDQENHSLHLSNKSSQMRRTELINLSGSNLRSMNVSPRENVRVDFSSYPPGIYFIRIPEEGYSARFIKQ